MFTLVLGGRRSGKSVWAENKALALLQSLSGGCGKMLYIATAPPPLPGDNAMQARINEHQERRKTQAGPGCAWITLEEPLNLLACLQRQFGEGTASSTTKGYDLVLIDCISLWLFNLMQENRSDFYILQRVEELAGFLSGLALPSFVISNEVGLGVAPTTELGNRFCDLAGRVNQLLAKKARQVVFVAAGLPLYLKNT